MKNSFIDNLPKAKPASESGLSDFIDEKINYLLEARENGETLTSTIVIDDLIDKRVDDLNMTEASLSLARNSNPSLDIKTDKVQNLIGGLAKLIANKLPDISLDEQLEKLDSLWELTKDSHNEDIDSEIHRLEIAYTNALYAHKNKEPGGSLTRILELETLIADLMSQRL